MNPSETAADYRRALNALRGFAAFYVVLYHLRYYANFVWFDAFPVLEFGYIGVDFFFILSGVIISHVYLENSIGGGVRFWSSFVWLRISRLFPVHFLIMALLLLAALAGPIFDRSLAPVDLPKIWDWLTLTFLFRQWLMPEGYVWNIPAWSISAEFFAYLIIFPVICAASRALGKSLGLLLVFLGISLWLFLIGTSGTVNSESYAGPLVRVTAGFVTGAGLFILMRNARLQLGALSADAMLLIVALCAIPLWSLALNIDNNPGISDALLIGYLVMLIVAAYHANGRISGIFSHRVPFWFGEISFSLYLCHVPVMAGLKYYADALNLGRGIFFSIACVATSVLAAHLLYKYVECPSQKKMREFQKRNMVQTMPKPPADRNVTEKQPSASAVS